MSYTEEQLIYLISWTLQRQLTWVGFTLASGLGIIRVLSLFRKNDVISWKTVLMSLKFWLYEILTMGMIFSLGKIIEHAYFIRTLSNELVQIWDVKIFVTTVNPLTMIVNGALAVILNNREITTFIFLAIFIFIQLLLNQHINHLILQNS